MMFLISSMEVNAATPVSAQVTMEQFFQVISFVKSAYKFYGFASFKCQSNLLARGDCKRMSHRNYDYSVSLEVSPMCKI